MRRDPRRRLRQPRPRPPPTNGRPPHGLESQAPFPSSQLPLRSGGALSRARGLCAACEPLTKRRRSVQSSFQGKGAGGLRGLAPWRGPGRRPGCRHPLHSFPTANCIESCDTPPPRASRPVSTPPIRPASIRTRCGALGSRACWGPVSRFFGAAISVPTSLRPVAWTRPSAATSQSPELGVPWISFRLILSLRRRRRRLAVPQRFVCFSRHP